MELFEEKLSRAKAEEPNFQMNSTIYKKGSKNIDKIKIYNKNIYVYIVDNSIKVYNSDTFKEISNLKLPFNRGEQSFDKEYIQVDILENGFVLILADKKLYFYEIDLGKNQLKFLRYLSEVYHFCYLQKKKEIFLLTENTLVGDYYGMAKSDVFGNIIFRNKKDQPQIYYEYKSPKEVNGDTLFFNSCSRSPIHFSNFDGFNNDKYIMNIWGYTDNWYYYQYHAPKDEKYNISIYNSDDLKEVFNKDYDVDLRYVKITDFYFKKCYDDLSIFYYNEKEKSINFITNITDKIYKYFNILSTGEKQISSNEQSFYLKDDMFCIFNGFFLFIIDLSSKNAIKKIEMKTNDNEEIDIKNLSLLKRNGKEYLYITINTFNNVNYEGKTKILNGIIL
jgi:hypothetical protein